MKLSTTELDYIDRFLEQQKLDFLDFKLEVNDHIATETENIMQKEGISFEEAFQSASKLWETELQIKKYWLISNERLFPEFVIQKIKSKVFFHYGFVLLLSIIGVIYYSSFKNESHTFLKYIIGFCGIVYFLLKRIIDSSKANTSYRFHFNYFHFPALLVIAYFFLFQISFVYAHFIGFIVITNIPFSVYYFIKHQQFVKKYNLT